MQRWTFASQSTGMALNGRPDNLYEPVADDGGERGRTWTGHTRESSLYTKGFLDPRRAAGFAAALVAAGVVGLLARRAALNTS